MLETRGTMAALATLSFLIAGCQPSEAQRQSDEIRVATVQAALVSL